MSEYAINLHDTAPILATHDDVTAIADLRSHLVDWMHDLGIDQWHHGEVGHERIREQVTRQEWWLLRIPDGAVAATIRILDEDPTIWGPSGRRALYLHGLMVGRRYAGLRLGQQLLAWGAAQARAQAVELLRLDCVASNRALCDYYVRRGFNRVGTKQMRGNWADTALFERSCAADEVS